jgi:hypothetical protein
MRKGANTGIRLGFQLLGSSGGVRVLTLLQAPGVSVSADTKRKAPDILIRRHVEEEGLKGVNQAL